MGRIGENIRKQMGLIKEEDKSVESAPKAKAEDKKAKEPTFKITAFGVKKEFDSDGNHVYSCVELVVDDSGIVEEKQLSPVKRQRKPLVLEDWKLNTGRFIINRDKW